MLLKALTGELSSKQTARDLGSEGQIITGFRPFPAGKAIVTNDVVNKLRETEGVCCATVNQNQEWYDKANPTFLPNLSTGLLSTLGNLQK